MRGEEVKLEFNPNSGNVFLVDEDCNVAMMNGEYLEDWFTSPYDNEEGFFGELKEEYAEMHVEDQEWLRDIAKSLNEELPELAQ